MLPVTAASRDADHGYSDSADSEESMYRAHEPPNGQNSGRRLTGVSEISPIRLHRGRLCQLADRTTTHGTAGEHDDSRLGFGPSVATGWHLAGGPDWSNGRVSADRLTAVDAQTFWMSDKIPNDTFLLFAFAGVPADPDAALAQLRARAATVSELTVRIDDGSPLLYPQWVPSGVDDAQIVVRGAATWAGCLDAGVELTSAQLDVTALAWRLHVFPAVEGVPTVVGPGTVAVLQISHALGGGGRTALTAALMFGRDGVLPEVDPLHVNPALLPMLGFRAGRAQRRLIADTEAGLVPPPTEPFPVLRTNDPPAGRCSLRTLVRSKDRLRGPTVTVAALVAIAEALAGHLDDAPARLGAELMVAKPGPRRALNHFGAAGIDLRPELPAAERAEAIALDIAARRQRAAHPALWAQALALAATPAPLLRWGVDRFDPDVRAPAVTGNTVVSSVNGGAADYAFGGVPVAVIAAFPGLSPMMSLTHCVSGIGDAISVSVSAAESAIGDVDAYLERLDAAL